MFVLLHHSILYSITLETHTFINVVLSLTVIITFSSLILSLARHIIGSVYTLTLILLNSS